jgi:hypothetical protein
MKTTLEVDRLVYELARDYLPSLKIPGVTRELIEKYLNPLSLHAKPASKEELYYRLLESAQEAGMKAGVIGGSIDGVKNLACVLNNFNPDAVLAKDDPAIGSNGRIGRRHKQDFIDFARSKILLGQ